MKYALATAFAIFAAGPIQSPGPWAGSAGGVADQGRHRGGHVGIAGWQGRRTAASPDRTMLAGSKPGASPGGIGSQGSGRRT